MKIPLLDLLRQYRSIKGEVDQAIERVLQSGRFILGPEVEAFEHEVAQSINAKHGIAVASGTDALWLALKAGEVGAGDGVILPSFTFFATAGAVHNVGATPIFADIDPRTYNIDPAHVQELLSDPQVREKTKAIIPVHLYGQAAEMDELAELADRYQLLLIEDAAQAIGAFYKGRSVGVLGPIACFSFFPSKNLGAYGDGGLVTTNDDELAERVRLLRVHGSRPKYYHHVVGTNSRLDSLQAAILRVKLAHLQDWTTARQSHAAYYDEHLGPLAGIVPPYRAPQRTHIYHQYSIRITEGRRDDLQRFLYDHGIGTEVYYPLPLHLQPCFKHLGYRAGDLPRSEEASQQVLSLPVFAELEAGEREHILQALQRYARKGAA